MNHNLLVAAAADNHLVCSSSGTYARLYSPNVLGNNAEVMYQLAGTFNTGHIYNPIGYAAGVSRFGLRNYFYNFYDREFSKESIHQWIVNSFEEDLYTEHASEQDEDYAASGESIAEEERETYMRSYMVGMSATGSLIPFSAWTELTEEEQVTSTLRLMGEVSCFPEIVPSSTAIVEALTTGSIVIMQYDTPAESGPGNLRRYDDFFAPSSMHMKKCEAGDSVCVPAGCVAFPASGNWVVNYIEQDTSRTYVQHNGSDAIRQSQVVVTRASASVWMLRVASATAEYRKERDRRIATTGLPIDLSCVRSDDFTIQLSDTDVDRILTDVVRSNESVALQNGQIMLELLNMRERRRIANVILTYCRGSLLLTDRELLRTIMHSGIVMLEDSRPRSNTDF